MTDAAGADAETERWSRRALLGAGAVAAVLAATESAPAAAAPSPDGDAALAGFAIGVELSARDLYRAAIDAGASGQAWSLLADQHASYAQRLAGLTGISANSRDAAAYDARSADFAGSSPANAAFALENALIATHLELVGSIGDERIADALAAIVSAESHHAAYLAERSGRGDNFDALFHNSGEPLTPAVAP